MKFPIGTKFNKWSLHQETQGSNRVWVIRRWAILPDGSKKIERLSVEKYKAFRSDEVELKKLLVRLNEQSKEERTKLSVELKHAFIGPELLDRYKSLLLTQIPSKHKARAEYSYLKRYFLDYFIAERNIPDPLKWHKIHKIDWANYLQSEKVPAGVDTKRDIISAANRFMEWLHLERPAEVPPLKFQPFTEAKFKELQAIRQMNGEIRKGQFIKDADWKTIKEKGPSYLLNLAEIAYDYGLRRAEVLGLKLEDVRKGYLNVKCQLENLNNGPNYAPLKGREERKVPHWNATSSTIYKRIESMKLMHPDTLTDLWSDFMKELGFTYTFHDLRHTWVTRMVRKHKLRDVQMAAGHKSMKTTERYIHDDRNLEDEQFIPDAS